MARIPSKEIQKETWLKYDEPSLRWDGNKDLSENNIVCYSEDELWDLLRAKKYFPQGDPELAAKKLPGNDFISYVLKTRTVFRRTIVLISGERIKVVFMSDSLNKEEILEAVKNKNK
ncbi:hypothetical protein ES702_01546 [subsurface metagenome]